MDINSANLEKATNDIIREILKERSLEAENLTVSLKPASPDKVTQEPAEAGFDKKLASVMEHSMIRPDATAAMVKQFCEEAIKYHFRNVALAPCFVVLAKKYLAGSGVRVATAVGFPMGIATTGMKVAETLEAIENGATEIDLPINIGMVKAGDYKKVKEDMEAVVHASNKRALIKAVIDLGALSAEEIIRLSLLARLAGADFLKVAAGSKPGGVTAEDIKLIRMAVGPVIGIKADGGIKDYKSAIAVIEAGATTIGASGSIKIVSNI